MMKNQNVDFTTLSLQSTLADLPTFTFAIGLDVMGQAVADAFTRQPDLPGVIVTSDGGVITAVSRRRFLEHVGRAYGVEVYLNRPIRILIETIGLDYLALHSSTSIQEAASIALSRSATQFYEPIVVENGDGDCQILDAYTLLLAQTQLLSLVNQVEQNRRQLAESLRKTGEALLSSLSLKKVTKRILKELYKVVAYERGTVMLRQDDVLVSIARRGFPKDARAKNFQVPVQPDDNDLFQRIVTTKQAVLVKDVMQESTWQQFDWLPVRPLLVGCAVDYARPRHWPHFAHAARGERLSMKMM